jgi:carbon storage regulator CsrA
MTHKNGQAKRPGCKLLVLTRRPGEGITMTDRKTGKLICHLQAMEGKGNQLRIKIEAPEEVLILRDELLLEREEVGGDKDNHIIL